MNVVRWRGGYNNVGNHVFAFQHGGHETEVVSIYVALSGTVHV